MNHDCSTPFEGIFGVDIWGQSKNYKVVFTLTPNIDPKYPDPKYPRTTNNPVFDGLRTGTMNIFIHDNNIKQCARAHCDQDVGKMILESAQLLCTALNEKGFTTPYRSTHVRHPLWLVGLSYALNDEYRWRYAKLKDPASIAVIKQVEGLRFAALGLTPVAQAMPDPYKAPDEPVTAYRGFYCTEKSAFATWTKRAVPDWYVPAATSEALPS
jgi:hypothetical protein